MRCKICEGNNFNSYQAREMMFGFKDEFLYLECLRCGCLQIAQIPADMAKYYPAGYYSFSFSLPEIRSLKDKMKNFIKAGRDKFVISNPGVISRIANFVYPYKHLKEILRFKFLEINKNSKILDVGCGNGSWIYRLKECGIDNCLGIDPYIQQDIVYPNGLKIRKMTIQELNQEFDLIAFRHSFEHIAEPLKTFQSISRLLSKQGVCLISMPTVSSYAWKHYRENWVQLDAPRHFFLYSVSSIERLTQKTNLKLKKVCYNSTAFQFWGSEQYLKNIPLNSDKSYVKNKQNSIFSVKVIRDFERRARQLNAQNQGDAATFYLQKD